MHIYNTFGIGVSFFERIGRLVRYLFVLLSFGGGVFMSDEERGEGIVGWVFEMIDVFNMK
jgi:hypothetical protein